MTLICPDCQLDCIKKNGYIHNSKQNHRCLNCGRQFVEKSEQKIISEERKKLIKQALRKGIFKRNLSNI